MEQSRGNTGRPNRLPPYLVLTIVGAIAIAIITAIFSTPLISAIIGIIVGVISIAVLYISTSKVSAHYESVIIEMDNAKKNMTSIQGEISLRR